jgi:hypothetical protein
VRFVKLFFIISLILPSTVIAICNEGEFVYISDNQHDSYVSLDIPENFFGTGSEEIYNVKVPLFSLDDDIRFNSSWNGGANSLNTELTNFFLVGIYGVNVNYSDGSKIIWYPEINLSTFPVSLVPTSCSNSSNIHLIIRPVIKFVPNEIGNEEIISIPNQDIDMIGGFGAYPQYLMSFVKTGETTPYNTNLNLNELEVYAWWAENDEGNRPGSPGIPEFNGVSLFCLIGLVLLTILKKRKI